MRDIWRLQHFLGVAEAGSFHSGARNLAISQPALTKSIRILEERFGTELFMRLPRGVKLTEAGEGLYKRAREVEAAWNAAVIEIGAQASGAGGMMRIGAGPVYSTVLFPQLLADLRRAFPKLGVSVSTGVGTELQPLLKTGDIRAYAGGVPDDNTELGPEFITEVLYEQANTLFAAADHPLFRDSAPIAPEQTLAFPWLSLFSGQQANQRIERFFRKQGLQTPELALESHSLQIAMKMIADHQFIACMPVPLVEAYPDIGMREIKLDDFRWSITTGVTFHRASVGFDPMTVMLRSLRRQSSRLLESWRLQ
ncbi:LysR family transcriptional regulator [Thioclava sp. BHET1]|nr:LysR family transcriptional regulator [Thioclava sp. BHET1]